MIALAGARARRYLNVDGISNAFIQQIATVLEAQVYAPLEILDSVDTLFIITRGLAMRNGTLLRKGDVWNDAYAFAPSCP